MKLKIYSYDSLSGEHYQYLLAKDFYDACDQVYISENRMVGEIDASELTEEEIDDLCYEYGVTREDIEI